MCFLCNFKKVNFPKIATSFFLNTLRFIKNDVICCFMNNKYTSISGGANTNHSATEKSHTFLYASGSNQVNVFVNKTKNIE